jgi:hypothetical protein
LKAIYFFERRNGMVMSFFTTIGRSFTLTAAACGDYVAMSVDDGERSYHTPPVEVENASSGQLGLWRSDLGEPQRYRNVKASGTPFTPPCEDQVQENVHLIRAVRISPPPSRRLRTGFWYWRETTTRSCSEAGRPGAATETLVRGITPWNPFFRCDHPCANHLRSV